MLAMPFDGYVWVLERGREGNDRTAGIKDPTIGRDRLTN